MRRIVVCKLLGMGSIVQTTPLLQTLKINFPAAQIIFLSAKKNKELLEEIKLIDKIISIDDKNIFSLLVSFFRVCFHYTTRRADLYFDLEAYSWFSTLLAGLSFATRRYGLSESTTWMRAPVYSGLARFGNQGIISKAYLELASQAGARDFEKELYRFHTPSVRANIPSPYILINPNASDLRLERRWAAENYSALIHALLIRYPHHSLVLTGSRSEKENGRLVVSGIPPGYNGRLVDTSGSLSLPEFIHLISNCTLMVTNDSGPMHLALALKKPVVALFGPGTPDHYVFPENTQVIYKKIHCSPCVHLYPKSPCNGNNQCMIMISTNEVLEACQKALEPNANQ